jgi:hypothetical protein
MSYASNYGPLASKANSGIRRAKTNPSQMGYSMSIPLDRVQSKQSLHGSINVNALNYPQANLDTRPDNSLGTISNFIDQTSTFAKDLYNETSSFLSDRTISTIPNYILVGSALALLFAFRGGKKRGRR